MTNYPMLDDKLATLRNAIEGGVKADSMQGLKLMELVDAIGEQFKREVADASAPVVDAAWDAYLDEQKRILGMPGLMARPSFIAGYRAALSARASEAAAGEPVAYVPIHPKNGPLWANTVPTLENDRPKHYETRALYFTAPPAASGQKLTLSPKARDALDSACSFFEIHGFDDYVSELRALLRASDSATASDDKEVRNDPPHR